MYWKGRVVAADRNQAVGEICRILAERGCAAAEIKIRACPVQPWPGTVWWEYHVKISRKGNLKWRVSSFLRILKKLRSR